MYIAQVLWPGSKGLRRYAVVAPLTLAGALLALYGIFAVVYGGDGSGPTYVKLAGTEIDAHLVGGVSLAVAAVLIAAAVVAATWSSRRSLRSRYRRGRHTRRSDG